MAGKMQKKATPRKRVNKNDQILALLIGLDKKFTQKFTGLDKNFKGLDKKVAGLDKKVAGLDKKVTGLDKKVAGLDKKVAGLDKKVTGLDKKVAGLDKKVAGLDKKFNRFESETARRFDDLELKIHGFKDEILSVVDATRKEYDETRQERIVMGAVQDRQQKEIETLKESASEQKQLLESLDARVTELEMNKAA